MMKKALVVLLLAAFLVPAFADDALVLPQGVWRTRVIPLYQFASDGFKSDFGFDTQDGVDQKAFGLGFSVEYGVNDWITAGAQWAPGMVLWSDVDIDGIDADVTVNPWFDLFLGGKFQIVGPNAPVQRTDMRLAVSLGAKVPFSSADWESEAENEQSGDDFVGSNVARNVLGVGGRFHFDYVFSPSFFVNLYSEFIAYPIAGEAPDLTTYGAVALNNGVVDALTPVPGSAFDKLPTDKFEYGYDLTVELEPHYIHVASPGLRITPSIPVTFTYRPELKLDGEKLSDIDGYVSLGADQGKLFPNAGPSASLSVGPTVEFFFTGLTVPTALQVQYRRAIAGQNSSVANAVVIQVKNYLKFW